MVKTIFLAKNVFFFHLKHFFMKKKILFGQITTKIFAFIGKHLFWENIDQKACHVV